MRYKITIVGIIFVVSVLIRLFLLHTFMSNDKHGSAPYYGSAAIGLYKYGTLSVTENEMDQIKKAEKITISIEKFGGKGGK
jgi:energy-converting hydrogenase Eha subunit H